jgi:PAS domain S-box-containing protein
MEGLLMSDMYRGSAGSPLTAQIYLEKQVIQRAAVANLLAAYIDGVCRHGRAHFLAGTCETVSVNFGASILSIILSFCLGLCCRQASAQAPPGKSPPRVLLLYSNDRLLPANLRFDSGFREVLDQGFGERYELFTEFLDAVRFPGEQRNDAMAASLRVRYKERPPQVLVAGGPEALDFFLNRRDSLFPRTPLVFGGLRLRDRPDIKFGPDVAGVPMSSEITPTMELVLRVRPRTREVVVVSGSAQSDRQWNAVARADFRPFESRIKVTFWDALPFAELTKRARALPPEAAMFYLAYFQEPDGTLMPSSARALEILAANCSAPIFGVYDTLLGKGLVGGQMTDFVGEGAAVGRLVQRIFSGEASGSIGVQPPRQASFYFDGRQLDRWGIPESVLPAGSQVLFRQPSLWQTHRNAVLLALTVISAQAALIFLLLAARRRAREMDANLSLAADAANVGLWHRNAATNHIKASPKWRALFGLPMTGQITMSDVMKRLQTEDQANVRKAIEGPASDGQSYSMEHRVVFPDGGTRWIASHGRADTGPKGQLIGTRGASMDITERKQAEEKFRLAVEASQSGILMFDSRGNILLVNGFAEKLFGFASGELPGQSVDAFLPGTLAQLAFGEPRAGGERLRSRGVGSGRRVVRASKRRKQICC